MRAFPRAPRTPLDRHRLQREELQASPDRLALAQDHRAEVTLNASEVDPIKAIKELTHGEGADATLDATGADGSP